VVGFEESLIKLIAPISSFSLSKVVFHEENNELGFGQ
jgi:hypothetical protein